jgi:hypothetical protein
MQGGVMAWFWEVIMAVVIFNIAFVSIAMLRSVILTRRTRSTLEERGEQLLPQESILRFLANLSLADDDKNSYLAASQKG